MHHPFADHIALSVVAQGDGHSRCTLQAGGPHMNPHGVVHGAVIFALADTGMGAALYPTLAPGGTCARVEVRINDFRPVTGGELVCETQVVNRGRTLANLESRVYDAERRVASANGNFAIRAARAPG